jgi:pimeloyl-ACP methyl ester carboxylesterase
MIMPKNDVLHVFGATLFYRVRGNGPLLLILAGGHGDADTTDALCEKLIDRYTVVTYDRRGLSRSTIEAAAGSPTIATHSEDVHQLLAALTPDSSIVFGSSRGALIGLDLVARHPKQVDILVAHEPPAWELLPDAERDRAIVASDDVVKTFRGEGATAALQKMAAVAGIDYEDREPEVPLPRSSPQIAANMDFFFAHDAPAVNDYRLDIAALKVTSTRIVVAGGQSSRDSAPHRCAAALAVRLGTTLVEFPGGHTGWLLRPNAFAAELAHVIKKANHQ